MLQAAPCAPPLKSALGKPGAVANLKSLRRGQSYAGWPPRARDAGGNTHTVIATSRLPGFAGPPRDVCGPLLHELATFRQKIAARIRAFNTADDMRDCLLCYLARRVGAIARP